MSTYVAVAVVVLAVLAILFLIVGRGGGQRRPTPLAGLAVTCVVCGIVFAEEKVLGYAFFLVGILLAINDAVRRSREGHRTPE
jgi:hypothetical protein